MTTKKKFDCVQMKWDIQQALDEEVSGLSPDEARKKQEQKLRRNPLLKGFLSKGRKSTRKRGRQMPAGV